jgi:hypothetical protein
MHGVTFFLPLWVLYPTGQELHNLDPPQKNWGGDLKKKSRYCGVRVRVRDEDETATFNTGMFHRVSDKRDHAGLGPVLSRQPGLGRWSFEEMGFACCLGHSPLATRENRFRFLFLVLVPLLSRPTPEHPAAPPRPEPEPARAALSKPGARR